MTPRDKTILTRLAIAFPVVFMFQVRLPEVASWFFNPIHPSVSELHYDLFNPWVQGCPHLNSGNEFTGCWGTNWGHFGGPYSIMWYWSMIGLSFGGSVPTTFSLFMIDVAITILLWSKARKFVVPYAIISTVFLLAFPQNMLSHMLTTSSLLTHVSWKLRYRFLPAIMAVAYKLPIGAGTDVWRFAFTRSVPDPVNWFPYALLGVWTLVTLGYLIRTGHVHLSNTQVKPRTAGETSLLPSPPPCHGLELMTGRLRLGGPSLRLSYDH